MDVVTKVIGFCLITLFVLVTTSCRSLKVGEWQQVTKLSIDRDSEELGHLLGIQASSCFGSNTLVITEGGNSKWFPNLEKVVTFQLLTDRTKKEHIMVYLSRETSAKTLATTNIKPVGRSRLDRRWKTIRSWLKGEQGCY